MIDSRKIPPQNIEAEMSVLGGVLLENETLNSVIDILQAEDFYLEAHRKIIKAMIELDENQQPCDLVTLTSQLKKNRNLESVGGGAYIATLVDYVPTAANIDYYCKLVKEKAIGRRLVQSATEIVTSVYEEKKDIETLLDSAQQAIFDISGDRATTSCHPLKNILTTSLTNINKLYESKERITGVSTGFYDLDELTAGFQRGELIIIAGRPSMGKTALAINIAQHAALHTEKAVSVVIFSLEMGKELLATRMLCSEALINASRLRTGHLQAEDFPKLANAAERLSKGSIFIDDSPSISALQIRAKARRLKAEKGLGMVVVDYLQLMQGNSRSENRQQEIAEISRSLKCLARELDVPVVALSQLSRMTEQRSQKDRRPILSDLRESGAIEQDADVVLFVHREEYYDKNNPELKGKAEIIIGKQRNGPIDTVHLAFLGEYTRFENLSNREEY
jgi:replicative DNA helicase